VERCNDGHFTGGDMEMLQTETIPLTIACSVKLNNYG